jgi:hypothetical protein
MMHPLRGPESLALFGLPLSDPMQETLGDGKTYTVQYFERARFENGYRKAASRRYGPPSGF